MKDLVELIRFLYTQFLLRDLAGKVLPGGLIASGVAAMLFHPQPVTLFVRAMSSFEIAIGIAFLWLTGLAVQALGIRVGWVRYSRRYRTVQDFHDALREFRRLDLPEIDGRQLERFMALREAYGNGAMAVTATLAFGLVLRISDGQIFQSMALYWPQVTLMVALAVALFLGHWETLRNQDVFWETAIHSGRGRAASTVPTSSRLYFLACSSDSGVAAQEAVPQSNDSPVGRSDDA